MYFCHTRLQIVENAVIKQNQVLASFIANVQNDIRGTWATPEALSAAKFAYAQDEGLSAGAAGAGAAGAGAAGPLAAAGAAGPLAGAGAGAAGPLASAATGPLAEPQMTNINTVVLASNKSNEEKTNTLSNIVLKKIDVSDDDSSDSCDTSSEEDESSSEEEEETKSFSRPASFGGMASFGGPSSFGGPNGFSGPNGFGNSTFIEVGDNNFIQTGGMKIIDLSSNQGFHLSSMFANLLNQQTNQQDDNIQLSGIEEIPDHESNKITLDPGVFDVQSVDVQVLDAHGLDVQSLDGQSLDLGLDLGVQSLDAPQSAPAKAPAPAPAPAKAPAPTTAPTSFSALSQMKVEDLRQHAINVGVVAKEQSRKLKKNELLAFFK